MGVCFFYFTYYPRFFYRLYKCQSVLEFETSNSNVKCELWGCRVGNHRKIHVQNWLNFQSQTFFPSCIFFIFVKLKIPSKIDSEMFTRKVTLLEWLKLTHTWVIDIKICDFLAWKLRPLNIVLGRLSKLLSTVKLFTLVIKINK